MAVLVVVPSPTPAVQVARPLPLSGSGCLTGQGVRVDPARTSRAPQWNLAPAERKSRFRTHHRRGALVVGLLRRLLPLLRAPAIETTAIFAPTRPGRRRGGLHLQKPAPSSTPSCMLTRA